MAQAMVNFRMDETLKSNMEKTCKKMGLTVTAAYTMFATKVTNEQRIPFEIARDHFNVETLEAFREVEEMKKNPSKVKSYSCFGDLLKEIEDECIE